MGNIFNKQPPNMKHLEAITKEQVKEKLGKYGVCYVPNVLTDEERLAMISGTWDFFEHLTQADERPIKRNNPESWNEISSLCPINDMLFHHWNAGHAQCSWDVRQNPKIVSIFAELWECDPYELLVSFDGIGFLLPPEVTGNGWHTPDSSWFHLDQSLTRPYFDGVQAMVTAYDVKENDAAFAFYEGSHNYNNEFIDKFGILSGNDWVPFNAEQVKFFADRCIEKRIICPAKSLIIWDSRTVHCGLRPLRDRKESNTRCITYLSYSKKDRISDIDLKKKKLALRDMFTSNHYAHKPNYFATLPQGHSHIDDYVTPIHPPILTKLGRSLAGFTD